MKQTLKFLLSISNTKMVVLSKEGQKNCYIAQKDSPLGTHANFTKLANFMTEYD